ncbi:MAG: TonB-dependent receptor [Siphonobacter sp.]
MKPLYTALLLTFFPFAATIAQPLASNTGKIFRSLNGYVREAQSGNPLAGVNITIPALGVGTTTNASGYYSVSLPSQPFVKITYSIIGYEHQSRVTDLTFNVDLNIEMKPQVTSLQEVVIKSRLGTSRVSESVQMSSLSIPIQQIKEIPALFGEKDILKTLQLLPGVQKAAEGNSGMYVRGGGPDQNLILLDEAPIYNTSHLFGFFSLFNGDAIESVDLTKGGFPAHFGGRLSSVIQMQTKDGNFNHLHGEAGIGLLSSRISIGAPLIKNKVSFLVSARRTYADLLMKPFGLTSNTGYFYDLTGKLSIQASENDFISLSSYTGTDHFRYATNSSLTENGNLQYGNSAGTLSWRHRFSNALFVKTSLIYSRYAATIHMNRSISSDDQILTYHLVNHSGIRDAGLKSDLVYQLSQQHTLKAGLALTARQFRPSTSTIASELTSTSNTTPADTITLNSTEAAVYVEDTYRPVEHLQVNAGLRLSVYQSGSAHYAHLEPRLAIAYSLPNHWAMKASFSAMTQYVHLLSSSGIGLPTDIWVPATQQTAPQQAQQVAIGLAKDFKTGLAMTLEGFYKHMTHQIAYQEGASSLSGSVNYEDQITYGQGWSYGTELLLQKKTGRLTGWVGYTLSFTPQQFEELNSGETFWARYDRRHDLSVVGIYHLNSKITLSSSFVYGSGQAMTLPSGQYWIQGSSSVSSLGSKAYYTGRVFNEYDQRNGFRAAAYQRVDVGIQFHKVKGSRERTWEVSLYNATNHQNPFFYYLDTKTTTSAEGVKSSVNQLKQVTLFPILPSVTYSCKF